METRAILDVLRKGQIVEGPALDAHDCWRCTMRRFPRGGIATVAVAPCEDKLVIVTAYEEREQPCITTASAACRISGL